MWQTARVVFHETFWVVTGTAAPVIALAAVVSVNDLGNETGRLEEALDRASEAFRGSAEIEAMMSGRPSPIRLVNLLARLQTLNILLQALLLTVSLVSIDFQRNLVPVWISVLIPVVGVVLLMLAGYRVPQITHEAREIIRHVGRQMSQPE
jgi:hypothetical protein